MNAAAPIASRSAHRTLGFGIQADPHARHAHARGHKNGRVAEERGPPQDSVEFSREARASAARASSPSPEMRRVVQDLQARDREVRAHETAHKTAGGRYAGAIHLEYTTGPDGRQYAVGGEVQIDTAPVDGDPEATIEKMRTIQAAALAPAKPSAADRSVAAKASQVAIEARIDS